MLKTYFAKVGHGLIGAALEECCCLLTRPDSNDQAETAGASRSNEAGLKDLTRGEDGDDAIKAHCFPEVCFP
jgi:hypothetical protein